MVETPRAHETLTAGSSADASNRRLKNAMSCYPDSRSKSSRLPFIVTAYHPDEDGVLHPVVPDRCPYAEPGDEAACRLRFHHVRPRKTGPCFGLAVFVCATHGHGFTLYPPAFAPYQRSAVVRLAPEGSAITPAGGGQEALGTGEERSWRGDFQDTFFEAALEAAEGKWWPRASLTEVPDRWFSTQSRHLTFAADLLGVSPALEAGERERLAAVLGTDLLTLREGARQIRARRSAVTIGGVVRRVLLSLRGGVRRALRLLFCGHVIGQWGRPSLWDGARRRLITLPFP